MWLSRSAPRMEEHELRRELESQTEEEREQVLSDLYGGNLVEIQETEGMVAEAMSELLVALDSINDSQKQSFLQAQVQCPDYVNSQAFRLMFLRADRFDTSKAAHRIVRYWDMKLKLFGPQTTFHRITHHDMREVDHYALTGGGVRVLPGRDNAGRAIFFSNRDQWDRGPSYRETMLRAIFYKVHEMVEDETVQRRGFVLIAMSKTKSRLHEYDRQVGKTLFRLIKEAIPVRLVGFHHIIRCGVIKNFMPYAYYLMSKEIRARYKPHFGPVGKILDDLFTYGIPADIMPKEMGGGHVYDGDAWLQSRIEQDLAIVEQNDMEVDQGNG